MRSRSQHCSRDPKTQRGSRARKARGLDASLRAVADQPYGPYLLTAVALALACYGIYLLLEVRYRKV